MSALVILATSAASMSAVIVSQYCVVEKCKRAGDLTLQEIIGVSKHMIPEPVALLSEVLQCLKSLRNDGGFVLVELLIAHIFECCLEPGEEVVDSAFKISAIAFALDQDAETSVRNAGCGA